jgi:hypothetical protein
MGVTGPNKRWEAASARPITQAMSFDGDFLVLGAQTCLAKVDKVGKNPSVQSSDRGFAAAAYSLRSAEEE